MVNQALASTVTDVYFVFIDGLMLLLNQHLIDSNTTIESLLLSLHYQSSL